MEKKILLITMGGTISGRVATNVREGELIKDSDTFTEVLSDAVASLKATKGINVLLEHFPLCDIDSSDVSSEDWIILVDKIYKEYDNYDAFIVTHGTNTMGYTAAALSFALPNIGKPVIITGSQVPAGMIGSDAVMNLENALRLAVYEPKGFGEQHIAGVVTVFGSHIITGTRVKKTTEFDYDTFKSFGGSTLGRIGRIINIDEVNLTKHNKYLSSNNYRAAMEQNVLVKANKFDLSIASFTEFPDMDPKILITLVEQNNIKGFILRSFGAGDTSGRFLDTFRELKNRKIPIVITTQAPNGSSNFQVNEPGQNIARESLAIPAHDMSIESQTVKLAWLLAKVADKEIGYDQLCSMMVADMHGEIKVIWEV